MKVIGKLARTAGVHLLRTSHRLDKLSAALEIAHEAGDQNQAKRIEAEMDQVAVIWAAWDSVHKDAKARGL